MSFKSIISYFPSSFPLLGIVFLPPFLVKGPSPYFSHFLLHITCILNTQYSQIWTGEFQAVFAGLVWYDDTRSGRWIRYLFRAKAAVKLCGTTWVSPVNMESFPIWFWMDFGCCTCRHFSCFQMFGDPHVQLHNPTWGQWSTLFIIYLFIYYKEGLYHKCISCYIG